MTKHVCLDCKSPKLHKLNIRCDGCKTKRARDKFKLSTKEALDNLLKLLS